MVNLYGILKIPENADRLTIERAIRLARTQGEIDERYLQLASNYLLDEKRRAQYHKQMGMKVRPRERASLSVSTDWRYVGGGIALVLVLFVPLLYVMLGQQKATEKLYQQQDSQYQQAQEAMEKAWSVQPQKPDEMTHQAVQRQMNEITNQQQQKLEQTQE